MSNKQIIKTRLNKFLRDKNFEEVEASMLAAESFGVSKPLLKRSYLFLGKSVIKDDQYSAIFYLNKARAIDPVSKIIFELFVKAIQKFFRINVEEFSKKDLEEYRQALLPIIEFHKLKFPGHRKIIDSVSHMFRRIDYRIKYEAKDVVESKISYRVQQIKNSLYGDLRPQEIKAEFARLIEDDLRNILDKPNDDKSKKKKSGRTINKKPPK